MLLAGPCSLESPQQLAAIVRQFSAIPAVDYIRCGIWKPRTQPGGFEGYGEQALRWIANLRSNAKFCCEVARPEHVELALRYGIDALWIGARTTANPFLVQEVVEALRGTDIPLFVKNAPSPDVKLWIGAIERCRNAGITQVSAVHRGFSLYQNDGYRNSPLWEVPIELRRAMPDIPLLCDPSHIAGRREPLQALSQTALDLGFDGLMIEVHPCPEQALTDSGQQITPDELEQLLAQLVFRSTDADSADSELRILRQHIDSLDRQLLDAIAARFDCTRQIAQIKADNNLAIYQPKRWESLLQQRMESAETLGLDPAFVKALFERIHAESVRIQEQIIGE